MVLEGMVELRMNVFLFLPIPLFCLSLLHYGDCESCAKVMTDSNKENCLREIKRIVRSKSEFWMGTDYKKRCPDGPVNLPCFNPMPESVDSLISRIFGSNDPGLVSNIDRLLEINYVRQPGSYQACGNTYRVPDSKNFSLDPTSKDINRPFDVRGQPEVIWRKRYGEGPYTLIMIDSPLGQVNHWTVVNIRNNDINNADILFPYFGSLNPFSIVNPYTFLLFKQDGNVTITPELIEEFKRSDPDGLQRINIPDLTIRFKLNALLAINVVRILHDPYSIQRIKDLPLANNCPLLVTNALRRIKREIIPWDVDLSVSVDVRYEAPPIKFTSCCNVASVPATTVELNPIGNGVVNTAVGRGEVVPMVTFLKRGILPDAANFESNMYTLLFVSPDVIVPEAGTSDRPVLRWMVTNIKNGSVANGDTVVDYLNFVSLTGPQFHFFLLYEQTGNIPNGQSFLTTNCPFNDGRCLFDINHFTTSNKLKLVGANWVVSNEDEYAKFFLLTAANQDPQARCGGIPGFGQPCPNGLPLAALLNE